MGEKRRLRGPRDPESGPRTDQSVLSPGTDASAEANWCALWSVREDWIRTLLFEIWQLRQDDRHGVRSHKTCNTIRSTMAEASEAPPPRCLWDPPARHSSVLCGMRLGPHLCKIIQRSVIQTRQGVLLEGCGGLRHALFLVHAIRAEGDFACEVWQLRHYGRHGVRALGGMGCHSGLHSLPCRVWRQCSPLTRSYCPHNSSH